MIVKPAEVRQLIRGHLDGAQISESAIVAFAARIQKEAEDLAQATVEAFRAHNSSREIQRIPPLHRVTDAHVEEASRGKL